MLRSDNVNRLALTSALFLATAVAPGAQTPGSELATARAHYNQRRYDEAIAAATTARREATTADSAAIVLARSHLERYRERADPADLSAAREALTMIRSDGLDPRDRVEFLLALGQSLFLEDDFGAAARMFESGLGSAAAVNRELGDAMLEWWGSAIERQAGLLERMPRVAAFSRLAARMHRELARHPESAAACYWEVVGLRGAGDADRAWEAAVAGWVRARLMGNRSSALRADLDRVVLQGVIPDRVRHIPVEDRAAAESQLKAEWELVKEKWK